MKNNDFADIAYNRHSIKEFDDSVKIPQQEMLEIINKTVKAPSSVNLQPWRFVVVESAEGKDLLRPLIRFNVRQNDTSAAMVVIFGDLKCHENAEDIFSRAVAAGHMPEEIKQQVLDTFVPYYEQATPQKMNDIVKIDASLAAMQFMLVARSYGYDTNPIGGFEEDQIAEALGLDPERFVPVMILAVGKANYTAHPSVRLEAKEITKFI